MTIFIVSASLLVCITLMLVIEPLWRGILTEPETVERKETNLTIFRDQLAELDKAKTAGALSNPEFEQTSREIHRRLLEEVEPQLVASKANNMPSQKSALVLMILLPLMAVGGYLLLGTPRALDPAASLQQQQLTPAQVEQMVVGLAAKLLNNPEDNEGWLMLARSYKMMGRNAEAAEAYGKVESVVAEDPDLLTDYADVLAIIAGGNLDGKPLALINKALHLDPDHVLALWLAGTAAFNKHAYPDAVVFWERATKTLPPDSEDRQTLTDGIEEAKRRSGLKVNPAKSVAGRVELSPSIKDRTAPDDVVFILARPLDGSRFPLAVAKVRVADLPYTFTLDDSLSMLKDKRISGQSQVIVEARISRSGNAIPKDGDLQSKAIAAKLGESKLRVVVDQVLKR